MENPLLIRIYSFSYQSGGPPFDATGNGGGFVFDCRGLPNPGRITEFQQLTGCDPKVAGMLESAPEVTALLDNTYKLAESLGQSFNFRGFRDIYIAYGCTGGRHRSVYCAEQLSERLQKAGYRTRVIHWQLEKEDSNFQRRRAMILAAGVGHRLQPLTRETPKALIPAGGKTMLDWTIEALKRAGFKELTINLHHHPEQIREKIENLRQGDADLSLNVSGEEELLGTAGGIKAASRWFHAPAPVLIHNVDVWSDFDLDAIYKAHQVGDFATLVCQKREASRYLLVDEEKKVCGITEGEQDRLHREPKGKTERMGFSGIYVLSTDFIEKLSRCDDRSIIDAFMHFVYAGETVRVVEMKGNWFDMGTPEKLRKLDEFLKKG